MATTFDDGGTTGVEILDRLIWSAEKTLTPDAARTLLSLKFEKRDERRMNQLSEKARTGKLTEKERFLAEQYNLISHMLALLQAKARGALKGHEAAGTP